MAESGGAARPTALGVVVFLLELVLLAVLAVAGARLGGGTVAGVLLALAFPVAAAVGWGTWLAPASSRRLRNPVRLAVKIVLVVVAAALLAAAGLPWWAAAFLVVTAGLFALGEIRDEVG